MKFDIAAKLQELGYQTIDREYSDHIQEWYEWYKGDVVNYHRYTIYNGVSHVKRQRKSLDMAKCVVEDWANLLLNERVSINVDQGFKAHLETVLKRNKFSVRGNQLIELAYALGTGALVEYINNEKIDIDYIEGRNIYPLAWDNNTVTECAFGSVKVIQNTECCYLMIHQLDAAGNYIIFNRIYEVDTGKEVKEEFYENAHVLREIKTRSPVCKFQLITPNIANNIDPQSPMGISVYANSLPVLQGLDMIYDSYCNEFDLGRKRVIIPISMARIASDDGTFKPVFDPADTVFYAIPEDKNAPNNKPIEINMTIRSAEHEAALMQNLSLLSKKCGLGNDRYQFDHDGVKTATEVVSEKSDLYQNLKKHELLLSDALIGMVEAVADLEGYKGTLNTSISFDDSVINDDNTKLANHITRIDAGLETHVDAIMDINNIPVEQARQKYQEIIDEQRVITGQTVDGYGLDTGQEQWGDEPDTDPEDDA